MSKGMCNKVMAVQVEASRETDRRKGWPGEGVVKEEGALSACSINVTEQL